jgi:prepilin-type N-terminal cleavage/methylation domain-containing protein
MTTKHRHPDPVIRHQGFTIVECLIGLAISAVLLTAVAAAFNASVISYRENEDMFRSMNNARQALARMTSQLRVAGYQHPTLGWLSVPYNPSSANRCSFWTADGTNITYEFQSADRKLYLRMEATHQEYVLCSNVAAAAFAMTSENGVDATSVEISLTVQSGSPQRSFQRTLAAAAVIRRNP